MDNILSTFPYFTTPVQNEAFQDLVGTHFGGKYCYLCIFLNDEVLLISKWKKNNDMLKKPKKKTQKILVILTYAKLFLKLSK